MGRSSALPAYPASYWDAQAGQWDSVVSDRENPHQFYYYEADLCISKLLTHRTKALELGCGTGGSTIVHARELSRLVAVDISGEMVRRAARILRRTSRNSHVDFVVADAAHLPFRAGVFDAVVSRGVVLSYAARPGDVLAEAHRVLRRWGKLGIDVMNHQRDWSKPVRGFSRLGRDRVYMETRVVGGRQVRRIYRLSRDCSYLRHTKGRRKPAYAQSLTRRPPWLRKFVLATETYESWMFKLEGIRQLASRTGFRKVVITPLGILPRVLSSNNRALKTFAIRNRNLLSELALFLSEHWRSESALHLFVEGIRK